MKQLTRGFVMALVFSMASAATASSTDPLEIIAQDIAHHFDGRWESHFEIVQSAFTERASRSIHISNQCHSRDHRATCLQSVDGSAPSTIDYDVRSAREVVVTTLDTKGHPDVSMMKIQGKDWIFPWTKTDRNGSIQYRIINHFNSPDSISWLEQVRKPGGSWETVGQGSEKRMAM